MITYLFLYLSLRKTHIYCISEFNLPRATEKIPTIPNPQEGQRCGKGLTGTESPQHGDQHCLKTYYIKLIEYYVTLFFF